MTVYAIAIVDNSTGQIEAMYTPGAVFHEEGEYEEDNTKTVVHLTDSVPNHVGFQQTQYYKNGAWTTREWKGDYYDWTSEEDWDFNSTRFWTTIREDREYKLRLCDWTQMADSPLTDEKKAAWATYRQALRALPDTNKNENNMNEIVWPTQPS